MNKFIKKLKELFESRPKQYMLNEAALVEMKARGELNDEQIRRLRDVIGQKYCDKALIMSQLKDIFKDVSEELENILIEFDSKEQKQNQDGIPSDQIYPMW